MSADAYHEVHLLQATPTIERMKILNDEGWVETLVKCHTCASTVHMQDIEEHLAWHRKHDEEPVCR